MAELRDMASAVTVRLGMLGGCVLGAFAGHAVASLSTQAGEWGLLTWPNVAGAALGLAASWAGLTWLARRHQGAGVAAGAALAAGAVAALLAWQRAG